MSRPTPLPERTPSMPLAAAAPNSTRRGLLRAGMGWGGLAALGPLAACGGGGDEGAAEPAAAPDLARRTPLKGVDTGGTGGRIGTFFSMALTTASPPTTGGVVFDTSTTVFVDGDGAAFPPAALAPGMNAEITAGPVTSSGGTQAQARALKWRSAEQLSGAVQAVDAGAATLTVLGQRVSVTSATVWDAALGAGGAQLSPGARVRVWGQLDTTAGRFVASRIDAGARNDRDTLRGVLTQFDTQAVRVMVGGVVAEAAPGAVAVTADLAVGQVVRLALAPDATSGSGGVTSQLLSIQPDALRVPDSVAAELEGRVTEFTSATLFRVDGVPVDARGVTVLGAPALALGARVQAQGRMSQGTLIARQVEVQSDSGDPIAELEGRVQSVQPSTRSFVVRGLTVRWSAATKFEGGSAALIRAGRKLAVKGRYANGRSTLEASVIHVEA